MVVPICRTGRTLSRFITITTQSNMPRKCHNRRSRPTNAGERKEQTFLKNRATQDMPQSNITIIQKKVKGKSRECHNHKPQPFPDTERKWKPTNLNKHKSNKRTKSTKTSSIFPKRGYRNAKRTEKKVGEKFRECHNHKPQPFPDPKRKRKLTNLNKHKPNKRTKSTKISYLFPKRGNRNTKRTEKHKNKTTHGKTYNKSPRRINHKATKSKTKTGTTALERCEHKNKMT